MSEYPIFPGTRGKVPMSARDRLAALEAERDVLDALCQERFDEIATLQAELAALKAPAVAGDEREAFDLAYSCAVENGWESTKELARYMWDQAGAAWKRTHPAQTEQQGYPHESMDAIALARYHVGPSGPGTLHRYAVRAGDGECELYRGSKSDCEHVARKLAGAFLNGGLTAIELYAAPIAQTPADQPSDCEWCAGARHDYYGEKCQHCAAPADGLVEALEYFVSRESPILSKFDLHGPADIAAGMRIKFKQAREALAAHRAGGRNAKP